MKTITYLLLLLISFGCQTDKENNVQKIKIPIKHKIKNKKTKIKFDTKKKLIEYHQNGKDTIIEFSFQNTGEYPLLISKAISNCGCTVTNYPKDSIYPNERGKIQARISLKSSKSKDTILKQTMMKIYGNFNDSIINLSIISKVIPNKKTHNTIYRK